MHLFTKRLHLREFNPEDWAAVHLYRSESAVKRYDTFGPNVDFFTCQKHTIIGTPEEVVAQLRAYTDVGLDELMLHWMVSGDFEGLRLLAEYVLPHFNSTHTR